MKKFIYTICLLASCSLALGFLSSCGDKMMKEYPWIVPDEGGSSDSGDQIPTDMDLLERELKGAIPFMINYSHEPTGTWAPHKYQYYRANNIDNYAGYWTVTKANFSFGPALPTLYTDDNGYLGGPNDNQIFIQSKNAVLYAHILKDENGRDISKPEWRAIALIIQAYTGHELVDFYGVCPFTDWRNVKRTTLTYQGGAEVYKLILADLDEAIAILKQTKPGAEDLKRVEGNIDNKTLSDWQWERWVKFANSLKLRMAMNIVDYDDPDPVYGPDENPKPFKAQNIAEEAINDEIGVLEYNDRDIAYEMKRGTATCCLYQICNWNDIRLNASLENILKHFKSPLLYAWFDDNAWPIKDKTGVAAPKGVYGVRSGIMMEDTSDQTKAASYGPFAKLSPRQQYMDQPFIKTVEVLFLRAEGALRGWNMGGTAQEFYEQGMRRGMEQFDVDPSDIETYINQTNLPAVAYTDYYQRKNSCDGRVDIDVKWNEADSKELKLEKIITQKWIHNFPMSAEAWTNFRRTGYPRLFPVMFNNMQGVDTELQIRRMTYTQTENNVDEISQITQLLGGSQTAGTQVFWDVRSRSWSKDANGRIVPQNF